MRVWQADCEPCDWHERVAEPNDAPRPDRKLCPYCGKSMFFVSRPDIEETYREIDQ